VFVSVGQLPTNKTSTRPTNYDTRDNVRINTKEREKEKKVNNLVVVVNRLPINNLRNRVTFYSHTQRRGVTWQDSFTT